MKKFLLFFIPLVAIGLAVAYFLYNKPHKDMRSTSADFKMTATELFNAFESDEAAANEKYLDQVIEVSGKVKEVSANEEGNLSLTLDAGSELFGVICEMDKLTEHERTDFSEGEQVSLKGICTGMLMDVVLVRCVEV